MFKHKRVASKRKRTVKTVAAVAGVAAAAVVATATAQAVVGGKPARIDKNSFMMLIKYGKTDFCAGVLAFDQIHVITSAQCLYSTVDNTDETRVIAGRANAYTKKTGTPIKISTVWIPDSFTNAGASNDKVHVPNNDIAVLRLAKPMPSQYKPIKWVPSGFTYTPGTKGRLLGWGTTSENQEKSPGDLREATLPLFPDSACKRAYQGDYSPENMICGGKPKGGVGACMNDRGAPLLVRDGKEWLLAGLASWGEGCAEAGMPDVMTKVSKFADDLASATK
ncbi:trypsin-like serine protease [Streptomyces sp. A012304]|uniref:S1 family peptidase n=1 Tax=Streptomyces sp. A012304 TaxID=375446 RepID=UPI002230B004|nr:serine protease [Streptomyces sp. A012304]GKQ39047.1 trypsin [Streptomyces sp. A012304]